MERSDIKRVGRDTVWESGSEEVFQLALVFRDGRQPLELFSVDDGEIEACLSALMQEQEIHDLTGRRGQTYGDIGESEDCFDVRYLLSDEAD